MPVWSVDGLYYGSDRVGDWQIWKMPAWGGEAVLVTKAGGFGTLSVTDEFATVGAPRCPRSEAARTQATGTMFITQEGVCFFDPTLSPAPAIKFLNFASRQVTTLVSLEQTKSYSALGSRIAVSPDGQWVLYSQMDQKDYEIMLVENFR